MIRTAAFIVFVVAAELGSATAQNVKIRAEKPTAKSPVDADGARPSSGEEPAISSSRQMLDLLGVADRLDTLADGADFPSEGDEELWRLLYTVRRFSLLDIDRWQRSDVTVQAIAEMPSQFRGELMSWTGEATSVKLCEPPGEAAERFNLARYYRCELQVGENKAPAVVYALAAPKEWGERLASPARVGVTGMFARLAGDQDNPQPILIARRIAWYPETPLGGLDMDVGLFDEVSSRPTLTTDDRECFYQLLAAVGRTGTKQLLRTVPQDSRDARVEPLFNQPQAQRGRLVELTGTARQAVLRRVEDRDIVARFGIDHFYEMEVFTDDSQGNPLTFCVRELPNGFPQGEGITESVRVAGFFFKKWGYRAAATTEPVEEGAVRKQLAPLLIGREPIWIKPAPVDQRFANGVFLVIFVVLTVVTWLVVLRLSSSDKKFHKQIAQHFLAPADLSPAATQPQTESASGVTDNSREPDPAAPSASHLAEADPNDLAQLRRLSEKAVSQQVRGRERQYATALVVFLTLIGVIACIRATVLMFMKARL